MVARATLLARLAESEDPVLAYKAAALLAASAGPIGADANLDDLRARIAGSPMGRALVEGIRRHEATGAYRKCQGPHWTLVSLAMIDYPPGDAALLHLMSRIDTWLFCKSHVGRPGTTVYPGQEDRVRHCASTEGNAIWYSIRLGLENDRTIELVNRLVRWQWPDGGWNCDRRREARSSSFVETAIPARGLWAFGQRHGYEPAKRAAARAAELLLSHRLLWRSDGSILQPTWGPPVDRINFPVQFYDVLYALQVMSEMGRIGDPRCAAALALLESKRLPDGGFPLENRNVVVAPDRIVSRGSFAAWGPAGMRHGNPLVSLAALEVPAAAEGARARA
jgi:hypothetical protein